MDSGIKCEPTLITDLQTFKEQAKYVYDFVAMTIQVDPNAPPPKGNKSAAEHTAVFKKMDRGECEKLYEGKDLNGVPAVHQYVYDLCADELKDKCCMFAYYIQFTIQGREQDKFIAINWVPDTAPMKQKMRYSSTFKNVCIKAPKINSKHEAHDLDDMKYKALASEVSGGKADK